MKKKLLFALDKDRFAGIFGKRDVDRIGAHCEIINSDFPRVPDKEFLLNNAKEAEIVVSTWETEPLDAEVMAGAGNLRLLTHAGGSVKPVVSEALWERGVRVTSAAAAIAYGVAEFCLGLMLTAPKRVYWTAAETRRGQWRTGLDAFGGAFEIYQQKVGIIGASHVGRHLIELLGNFSCDVLLYDPYCTGEQAEQLGATKVETLEELFSQCKVVSLNAPCTESTRNMIRGSHFQLLQQGALFINTARAAIVKQDEMVAELRKGNFIACIDVTEPEPPLLDDPLRKLPNVILTPHEAGVVAENMLRIGTFVADEIEAYVGGREFSFETRREDLDRIG